MGPETAAAHDSRPTAGSIATALVAADGRRRGRLPRDRTYTAFLDLSLGLASPTLGWLADAGGLSLVFLVHWHRGRRHGGVGDLGRPVGMATASCCRVRDARFTDKGPRVIG